MATDRNFRERAKAHTSQSLAEKSPNLLDELPASLADIAQATVYLEAAQALLQQQPINAAEIAAMLQRAVNACQGSEEKQRAMLAYVRIVREKMITLEDIRF